MSNYTHFTDDELKRIDAHHWQALQYVDGAASFEYHSEELRKIRHEVKSRVTPRASWLERQSPDVSSLTAFVLAAFAFLLGAVWARTAP